MVVMPQGRFTMGAPAGEEERENLPNQIRGRSVPQHLIKIRHKFAIAKFDVTRDEYAQFVAETNRPDPDSCITPTTSGTFIATQTLDDWIARVKGRGHAMLEEKQMKFRIERYGNIAHSWSTYTLQNDGKQVARGINSIQAIKGAGGWRITGILVQAESATAPLPKEYLP